MQSTIHWLAAVFLPLVKLENQHWMYQVFIAVTGISELNQDDLPAADQTIIGSWCFHETDNPKGMTDSTIFKELCNQYKNMHQSAQEAIGCRRNGQIDQACIHLKNTQELWADIIVKMQEIIIRFFSDSK